jgi:hypothetical protein
MTGRGLSLRFVRPVDTEAPRGVKMRALRAGRPAQRSARHRRRLAAADDQPVVPWSPGGAFERTRREGAVPTKPVGCPDLG